jgi:hypothetical protein
MSNWDRRALLSLSDAIRYRMKDKQLPEAQKELLLPIMSLCDKESKTVNATSDVLESVTRQLCEVCKLTQVSNCTTVEKTSRICHFLRTEPPET